jgi:hypothetical protein
MSYSPEYQAAFQALNHRMRFGDQSPKQAVHRWQAVVDALRAGEYGHPVELEDELESAREPLSTLIVADELAAFPEHPRFVETVAGLDAAFLALTAPWPAPAPARTDFRWWEGRVPLYWLNAQA